MANAFIANLQNKATRFPALSGIALPQPRLSPNESNDGAEALIPFSLYRLRAVCWAALTVTGTWSIDWYMEDINDENDTGAISFTAAAVNTGYYGISKKGSGYRYRVGTNYGSPYSNYAFTVASDASDVFSLGNEERLPIKCRQAVPYFFTTGVGTGESGIVDWYIVVDSLEDL